METKTFIHCGSRLNGSSLEVSYYETSKLEFRIRGNYPNDALVILNKEKLIELRDTIDSFLVESEE